MCACVCASHGSMFALPVSYSCFLLICSLCGILYRSLVLFPCFIASMKRRLTAAMIDVSVSDLFSFTKLSTCSHASLLKARFIAFIFVQLRELIFWFLMTIFIVFIFVQLFVNSDAFFFFF